MTKIGGKWHQRGKYALRAIATLDVLHLISIDLRYKVEIDGTISDASQSKVSMIQLFNWVRSRCSLMRVLYIFDF